MLNFTHLDFSCYGASSCNFYFLVMELHWFSSCKEDKFLLWLFVGKRLQPLRKWVGEGLHFYHERKWVVRSKLLHEKKVGCKRSKDYNQKGSYQWRLVKILRKPLNSGVSQLVTEPLYYISCVGYNFSISISLPLSLFICQLLVIIIAILRL